VDLYLLEIIIIIIIIMKCDVGTYVRMNVCLLSVWYGMVWYGMASVQNFGCMIVEMKRFCSIRFDPRDVMGNNLLHFVSIHIYLIIHVSILSAMYLSILAAFL